MKSFEQKYVICKRDWNGDAEVSTFTEDRRGNRIPLIVDTAADAVLEIAEHMELTAEAVKRGDLSEDSLDEPFDNFVAKCSLKKDEFYIWTDGEHEDVVIYEGSYKSFVIQNNS